MSNCCAPKTPFLPEQVLKAVEQIENLCSASKNPVCTPSLQANTQFGIIMDMSTDGSILVIGAPTFDAKDGNGVEQSDSGGVFVFKRKQSFAACAVAKKSASKYKLQQILVATDPKSCANEVQAGDRFGDSVSVSGAGSRIVVGATAQDVAGFRRWFGVRV